MKTVFALLTLSLLSMTASAYTPNPDILNPEVIQNLPTIHETSVTVKRGPPMAEVQPMAHLTFTYYACAAQELFAQVHEVQNLLFVAVSSAPGQVDCAGLARPRQKILQISSDFHHRVIILNPMNAPEFILHSDF